MTLLTETISKQSRNELELKSIAVTVCGQETGVELVSVQVRDLKLKASSGPAGEGARSDIKFGEIALEDIVARQSIGCLQAIDLMSEGAGARLSSRGAVSRFLQTGETRGQYD
jgi:hypothetical protein